MSDTLMIPTLINGQWTLHLPEHRSLRPQWGEWSDGEGNPRFGWEKARLDSMYRNIESTDIIYDLGAEEGDMAALYQSWLGPQTTGGLCLFEPNEKVWPNIKAIWRANHLIDPLETWVGFAGDRDNILATYQEHQTPWPPCADGPVIGDHGFLNLCERPDVSSVRLDSFALVTGYFPDIITIDVEGAEFNVLAGALEILKDKKPLVYVSIHPQFMKDMYDTDARVLHELMGQMGYRAKFLEEDHEQHFVFWHPMGRELKF